MALTYEALLLANAVVYFERLHPKAEVPRYATPGAAGLDIYACEQVKIEPARWSKSTVRVVSTGVAVSMPHGYEGQVRSRSGLARKHGVVVAQGVGTIDSDYRGEIMVLLVNLGHERYTVEPGDRIAQLVIGPVCSVELHEVAQIDETTRGSGGLGSTGR